jgi:RNA polymerase-binding transcription factor DksA
MKKIKHTPYTGKTLKEPEGPRYSDTELCEFKKLIISKLHEARMNAALLDAAITRHLNDPDDACPTFKFSEDATCVLTRHDLYALSVRMRQLIEQLKFALKRIGDGSYGVCWISGKLISKERLATFPHTLMDADSKRELISRINHLS